jgi:hypothetical protein
MNPSETKTTRREFLWQSAVSASKAAVAGGLISAWKDAVTAVPSSQKPQPRQKAIARVKLMPNLPAPYKMRDWRKAAADYDAFVFDFEAKGKFLPVIAWDDHPPNYRKRSFSMVSYIGQDITHASGEAINTMGAVVGATLAGIDKSNQNGHNFVLMCQKWFNSDNGENVYLNDPSGETGRSFWYELLPNILFFQLNDLYPRSGDMPKQIIAVADRYYEASVALGGRTHPWQIPDFNHTSFSFKTMAPVDNHRWREPDAAAAVAWLEYMAWVQTRDPRYLTTADWALQFLNQIPYNPFYECLLPYGAYLAARMNAELGRQYNTGRLLNWCFDGNSRWRHGWGVLAEQADGLDLHGLVGSITDGQGYGFAMNTFQQAGALAPIARYDAGYAHDIGKWMLNLANAARLFYFNGLDSEHQSSFDWATAYDKHSALSYEGIRRWKRGAAKARSDFRTVSGRIVSGSYLSTHFVQEVPDQSEVLEEAEAGGAMRLEHIWNFELPEVGRRWLVVSAHSVGVGGPNHDFEFSYAGSPDGPYRKAFTISVSLNDAAHFVELPPAIRGRLYVKAQSAAHSASAGKPGRLSVDAMAITYQTAISPYAQGDNRVKFEALIDNDSVPIVLYRPASATTDFALYGSSHVGILGGLVARTNVEGILQIDLLKTDYYHAPAFPTFLYYNPYPDEKSVRINVGAPEKDLYDSAQQRFVKKKVKGVTSIAIPGDTAVVLVVVPSGGRLMRQGKKFLIEGKVVCYG